MDRTSWTQGFHTGGQAPAEPDTSRNTAPEQTVYPGAPAMPEDYDYPFEEPEQAPELRSGRSESLYSRSEPFWDRVYEPPRDGEEVPHDPNYWNHPEVLEDDRMMLVESNRPGDKLKASLGSGVVKKTLIVLAVLLAVAGILYGTLFQVRDIIVTGNASVPADEIIRLSGLHIGMNTMTIDEKDVARRIENNRYLRCNLVDVKWNSVELRVTERIPAVYINHNGMLVMLDNRGWVLEESLDTDARHENLISVVGLHVSRCILGQAISLTGSRQMSAYTRILVELKAMKGLPLVKELDLSDMDRIYLETRDGFYIHMGSDGRIHEKLRSWMITREKVIEMGYEGGTIDVTDPEKPTFTPAGLS